jgi:hypothetical protein
MAHGRGWSLFPLERGALLRERAHRAERCSALHKSGHDQISCTKLREGVGGPKSCYAHSSHGWQIWWSFHYRPSTESK